MGNHPVLMETGVGRWDRLKKTESLPGSGTAYWVHSDGNLTPNLAL